MSFGKVDRWFTRSKRLLVAIAMCSGLILLQGRFRLGVVIGDSMLPGLTTGDILLIHKRAYDAANPGRGDVVLARFGNESIVKRVVGLPGEEVALQFGRIYVNGEAVAEPQKTLPGTLSINPGRLFRDRFALLGDNRTVGLSTFVHAVVSKDEIVGKVVATFHVGHFPVAWLTTD